MTAIEPTLGMLGFDVWDPLFGGHPAHARITDQIHQALTRARVTTFSDRFTLTVSSRVAAAIQAEYPEASTVWGMALDVDEDLPVDILLRVARAEDTTEPGDPT